MENGIEKKILQELCVRLVANKEEIMKFLSKDFEVPETVVNTITRSLVQKGMLTKIYSSTTSFAITQKGMKEANLL